MTKCNCVKKTLFITDTHRTKNADIKYKIEN